MGRPTVVLRSMSSRQLQVSPSQSCSRRPGGVGLSNKTHTLSVKFSISCALVYSFGSGEKGQLGRGRTGEHIISAGKTGFDIETEPGGCGF